MRVERATPWVIKPSGDGGDGAVQAAEGVWAGGLIWLAPPPGARLVPSSPACWW